MLKLSYMLPDKLMSDL